MKQRVFFKKNLDHTQTVSKVLTVELKPGQDLEIAAWKQFERHAPDEDPTFWYIEAHWPLTDVLSNGIVRRLAGVD